MGGGSCFRLGENELTHEQMREEGYTDIFHLCFELLSKYADAVDAPDTWEQCCTDAMEIYRRYECQPLAPLASALLSSVFDEIGRIYSNGTKQKPDPGLKADRDGRYRFTLP